MRFFLRKAIKIFKPLSIDELESEELKSIEIEIEILKKLSSKSDYVIKYLDSFLTEVDNHNIYHIVTSIYEVKYSNFISILIDKYNFLNILSTL